MYMYKDSDSLVNQTVFLDMCDLEKYGLFNIWHNSYDSVSIYEVGKGLTQPPQVPLWMP